MRARPAGTENTNIRTGEIEALTKEIEVLNPSVTPPFLLDDGSGKAVVEVHKAEMIVQGARQWIQGKRRYTEWIIAPGEHVYAIGGFASEGGPNTTLNADQDVSALIAEWKRRRVALLERFDLDGDRNLVEREWVLARTGGTARGGAATSRDPQRAGHARGAPARRRPALLHEARP